MQAEINIAFNQNKRWKLETVKTYASYLSSALLNISTETTYLNVNMCLNHYCNIAYLISILLENWGGKQVNAHSSLIETGKRLKRSCLKLQITDADKLSFTMF